MRVYSLALHKHLWGSEWSVYLGNSTPLPFSFWLKAQLTSVLFFPDFSSKFYEWMRVYFAETAKFNHIPVGQKVVQETSTHNVNMTNKLKFVYDNFPYRLYGIPYTFSSLKILKHLFESFLAGSEMRLNLLANVVNKWRIFVYTKSNNKGKFYFTFLLCWTFGEKMR